jgi:maltose phosphorylase
MKSYIKHHPWKIIEEDFNPSLMRNSQSIFSIGNGFFGQRANFEETYSGDSLQGSYIAGVYYPDKTRVGWWKNGYPEYFAKVLNAPSWITLEIEVDGHILDLAQCKVSQFRRELDMQHGLLVRSCEVETQHGVKLSIHSTRFCSMANNRAGAINYRISPLNRDVQISVRSMISSDVRNEDANYDEHFWEHVAGKVSPQRAYLQSITRKTEFHVAHHSFTSLSLDGKALEIPSADTANAHHSSNQFNAEVPQGKELEIVKLVSITSSLHVDPNEMFSVTSADLDEFSGKGWEEMRTEHEEAWKAKWAESDIEIVGDVSAQQAIRFNIFQLNQTYSGEDARLNIGPKGFTGEKYGGSTYWDTEAYCLPFYLATAPTEVARNLLIYRYKHLDKAIENAEKLGFTCGAALYPMVTMNGEECHNEWEITFEEIHRNGAIAYAIYDYVNYTGDTNYVVEYGLEVLIGIARFWAQRVNWSEHRKQYVMLGVTGPNEFENNVNNNWYTNKMAAWCLDYAREQVNRVKDDHPTEWERIAAKTNFNLNETNRWEEVSANMYYPYSEEKQVFLQQDGFLDKEIKPVSELPENQRPIVEHWSWDRILRSCYIKQADTLQGFYFFEDDFSDEEHKRHFEFYEPLTVHESSLSPCVHNILAAKLGMADKAYEMYLRTARLDLDDYNNDTCDGLHITSMAGTWMSITKGFAGMRVKDGELQFSPMLPPSWEQFSFTVKHNGKDYRVLVDQEGVHQTTINQSSS